MNRPRSEEHLKAYEPAARLYCAKAGLDADEQIAAPHIGPSVIAVNGSHAFELIPMWHFVAEDLIHLSTQLTALREAASVASRPGRTQ